MFSSRLCVTHNGLSERGTTHSLNRHKNTTAIRTDELTIASTHHGNRTALRISNAIRFSVIDVSMRFSIGFFGVSTVTIQQPFEITLCTPRVENAYVTCDITLQVKFISLF